MQVKIPTGKSKWAKDFNNIDFEWKEAVSIRPFYSPLILKEK